MGYFYYPIEIGYLPSWIGYSTAPDLSQVIHLDNARWSFLVSNTDPATGAYTYPQFGVEMDSVYGEGALLVTPFPTGNFSEALLDQWRLWIPAVGLGFENTIQARLDGLLSGNNSTLVVKCPLLHRVFVANGLGVPLDSVWEFNNGVIGNKISLGTYNARTANALWSRGDNTNGWSFLTCRSSEIADLVNVNNWGVPYNINPNTSSETTTRNLSTNTKSIDATTLQAIFGDADEPLYPPTETDPYLPEGVEPSTTGGGTGTFSETGDTIGIPGLPALSAVDTGFITLFNPSAAQVKALAAYMWSASFDLATFKNIVANPIDCILGLSIVPVNPPNAGSKVVTVGNIPTDVTLPYLSSQYVEVDCGTLNVQEFWGSYLDYSPYTKMSLYLPYIGIIPLDIDDVMNASIAIKYHVDVLSGACVAYVLCNGTQLYTYVGQCSSNVPITSNDFTNTVNGILGIAGSIGKLAADGGASAPTEAAGIAANAINALKPNIQKSGAMSGTGGLMGVQTPYLICQRPRQSVPASQNTYTGYPANITAKLSDLSGYTEVENIHLDGLSATQEEQQEIMDLLTSGVII